MKKFGELIPEASLNLVSYSGQEVVDRLGNEVIAEVVLSVLCGDNVRNLTEGLTRRRTLLINASLLITYLRAITSYKDLHKILTDIISSETKVKISDDKKRYLNWFIGITGKGFTNVIRGEGKVVYERYLTNLNNNLSDIAKEVTKLYGPIELSGENEGIKYLLQWPDLLRCMLAIGSSTLTIRGSEKSLYGKLFEKLVLGSVLSILGFKYIDINSKRNTKVFWLSERENKRESDATALLKPGYGIRFDIGFIGTGNTEISLDKVSRFEREMERNGYKHNTVTIILVDKIGDGSRIEDMARVIGGYIIQMSGTYWVHKLANTIKEVFPFYRNPLINMTKEKSLDYLKKEMPKIDLSKFLSNP